MRKLDNNNTELLTLKSAAEMASLEDVVSLKYLLLEDTDSDCCPVHLRQLLYHFDTEEISQNELLMLLVYAIGLEVGFVSQDECANNIAAVGPTSFFNANNLMTLTKMPPNYVFDEYKSHFTIKLCIVTEKSDADTQVMLNCVCSGDFMIASLTPCNKDVVGSSACLSVGRYVLNRQPKGELIHGRLLKLDELSLKLRNDLFIPVRDRLFQLQNPPVYPSLSGLPPELYEKIFQYLNENQMKIMANVNRDFYYCSRRSKHFGGGADSSKSSSF